MRRTLAITVFIIIAMACAAGPALAYGPYHSYTVDAGARLVQGAAEATVMWQAQSAGTTKDLLASRFPVDGASHGPVTVVSGIAALDGWYATGQRLRVTVVWKDGPSVFVKQVDLGGGPGFDATLSTDGTVVPAGVAADGSGGAFIWLASAVAPGVPNILNHVDPAGVRRVTTGPGVSIAGGAIAALDVDSTGHAFALLAPPGRNGLAVQRYAADLTHWSSPISVYSPFEHPSAATLKPIGIVTAAPSDATVAWQEGSSSVRLQRYSSSGLRWIVSTMVAMTGGVLSDDGLGGAYLIGPDGSGLTVRHILSSGLETGAPGSRSPDLGLSGQQVDGVTVNRTGDLFVACSDAGATASRVELMTALGAWSDVGPTTQVPGRYSGADPDGSGGAVVLGDGSGAGSDAVLWRIAGAAPAVTFRPRSQLVQYGKSVTVAGYSTLAGGLPAASATVRLGKITGGAFSQTATATTNGSGFYQATLKPTLKTTWTASSGGIEADAVEIDVMPNVTLALSHLKAGTRLTETFTGSVAPRHAGSRVVIQKAVGASWRTVASGRLDAGSHFKVTWRLPYKTATYKLRAAIPAHADHAEGASQTASLRVVIRKG